MPNFDIGVMVLVLLFSFWLFTSKNAYTQALGLIAAIITGIWVIMKHGNVIGL